MHNEMKLTDMENHVLLYLQSFCSLEEKGVQERSRFGCKDRIINGIMFVKAIRECRLLCDFEVRKVCYSELKQEINRVRRMTL